MTSLFRTESNEIPKIGPATAIGADDDALVDRDLRQPELAKETA